MQADERARGVEEGTYWKWSFVVCTVTGVPRDGREARPKARTVSLDRMDRQLVELSVDPWRPTFSFLVMVGQGGAMGSRCAGSGVAGAGRRARCREGSSRRDVLGRLLHRGWARQWAAHGRGEGGADDAEDEAAGQTRAGQRGDEASRSGWRAMRERRRRWWFAEVELGAECVWCVGG